jgi:hypothetical protein
MASTTPTAVLERLIDDDYLHEQIAAGGERLRAAYRRGRAIPRRQAVQDRKLYDHVREAVASLTEAARRLAGRPKPEPPKRRGRRVATVVIGLVVVAVVRDMHRRQQAAATAPGPPTVSG